MNLYAKAYWSNNPIPVNQQVNNPDFIINVPIGVIISEGGDVKSVNGKIGVVVLDSADVGAPSLTYVNEQLDTKANSIAVTQALSTKADLVGGLIPANQLPSFVDDVLEYASLASLPVEGEASKIYVALDTNKTYRWGGSSYVELHGGVTLGETALTAYRGDRGKIAYDHSLSQGNPHNATTSEITEGANKYFTETRVGQTVLTGLNTNMATPALATDQLLAAIGKLQAQINNIAPPTWVSSASIGTVHPSISLANNFIELARINGMLWVRGSFKNTSSIIYESQPHFLKIDDIQYKIIHRNSTSTTIANITPRNAENNAPTIAFKANFICVDATGASTSNQYFMVMATTLPTSNSFYHIPPTCLGELVIK